MNEIIRIHIAKVPYEIEIDAKKELRKYLNDLKKYIDDEGILADVEIRITEILADQGVFENGIINKGEIEKIKQQLGEAKVFSEGYTDGAEEFDIDNVEDLPDDRQPRKLFRDTENGIFGGVASGLSLYFNLDVALIRVIMICLSIVTFGWGVMFYAILWVVTPKARNAGDILRTKGQKITAASLRDVNSEYDFDGNSIKNRRALKVISIVAGSSFVFMGVCAAIMLIVADISIASRAWELFSVGILMANVAGLMFIIFCGLLAYICFRQRATIVQFIALVIMVVLGLTTFTSGMIIESSNSEKTSQHIKENIVSSRLKVDQQNLAKIKTLSVDSSVNVEYITSKDYKVEVYEYKKVNKLEDVKLKFDDDNLSIKYNKDFIVGGDSEKIVVYGPEINSVSVSRGSLKYQAKSQPSLKVNLADSASISIPERIKIDNFSLKTSQYNEVYANDVSVDNLKIELSSASTLYFKESNKTVIKTDRDCPLGTSALNLLKGRMNSAVVDGADYGEYGSRCVEVDIEHEIN